MGYGKVSLRDELSTSDGQMFQFLHIFPKICNSHILFSFSSHSVRCAEYPPVSTLLHTQLRARGPLSRSMSLKSLALLSLHSISPERDTHPLPFFVPGPLQWGSPQKQLFLQLCFCGYSFVKHSISSQTSSSVFQSLKNAPGTPETPLCLQKLCLQKLPPTSLISFMFQSIVTPLVRPLNFLLLVSLVIPKFSKPVGTSYPLPAETQRHWKGWLLHPSSNTVLLWPLCQYNPDFPPTSLMLLLCFLPELLVRC